MAKRSQKTKNKEIAYTIKDKTFGKLSIKKSANAWWMDRGKVERLITGFKLDCKVEESRVLAGISKDQLDYFKEIHPEFYAILEDMQKMPTIQARMTVVKKLKTDSNLAFKYLERKASDEFKERKEIDSSEYPKLVVDI